MEETKVSFVPAVKNVEKFFKFHRSQIIGQMCRNRNFLLHIYFDTLAARRYRYETAF